jgi:hypothetical protein
MGQDAGEWGGALATLDLKTGKMKMVTKALEGVLGFLKTPDDHVLAYGGTSHLGAHGGFIVRVDGARIEPLAHFDWNDWEAEGYGEKDGHPAIVNPPKTPPVDRPYGPIDIVLGDDAGSGYWVVSAHELYHCDAKFAQWRKAATLGGRWFGGRKASVGNTPTINELFVGDAGRERFIAVMGRDGLERVAEGKVDGIRQPGQLEGSELDIWNTDSGTVLLNTDWDHSAWQLESEKWKKISLFPDREPGSDDVESDGWSFAEPAGRERGAMQALSRDGIGPGELDLVRIEHGVKREAHRWTNHNEDQFSDGFLENARGDLLESASQSPLQAQGAILALENGEWVPRGKTAVEDNANRSRIGRGRRFPFLASANGMDYFLDADFGDLLQLVLAGDGNFTLEPARFKSGPAPAGIFDAFVDGDKAILLARGDALTRLNLSTGETETIPQPGPGVWIASICRDGEGALWALGDRLFMSRDEGRHWAEVSLPMLTWGAESRVRPDAAAAKGLILALGNRGVVYLTW